MNTVFFKSLTLVAALALPISAFADHSNKVPDHHAMPSMQHGDLDHGHEHAYQHEDAGHDGHGEHKGHEGHEGHEGHAHGAMNMAATITQTDEVAAALAAGGTPIVADVLGVVCDFCAVAMNKIFGKRDEVTAVYVDLDKKTLSLVIGEGEALSDKQIEKLAKRAGYRIAAIRRDGEALGG